MTAARDLDYSAVAVIGSRGYRGSIEYALAVELQGATSVISGGARGVDRAAEAYGEKLGIRVVSYRPQGPDFWVDTAGPTKGESGNSYFVHKWVDGQDEGAVCHDGDPLRYPTFGEAAKARNWWIVRDAGRVAALWDGTSSGTAHGIAAATRFSRPVRIWMDGDS